jgi:hypothetical protein
MNRRVVPSRFSLGAYRLYPFHRASVLAERRQVRTAVGHLLPLPVRSLARKIRHHNLGNVPRPVPPGLLGILPVNFSPELPSAVLVLSIIAGLPAALWVYKVE